MKINTNTKIILLILIAFAFSFSTRLIWVQQFSDANQFKFNNEFMINTNDGYYYAEGARDILSGVAEKSSDLSPIDSAASILTAYIIKFLPFSIETILFYMPAFFASLLVIPLILIGKSIGRIEVGFIAALLASIAWSYYNRTMVGYYDTDLLNIVFPTILLWSLIWAIKTQQDKYLLFTALDILAYRWWYPQSYSLEFAFFSLIVAYGLYLYIRKIDFKYILTLGTFMMFAMMGLDGLIRFGIVILLYATLKLKKEIFNKYIYYIFISSLILFLFTGGFDPIFGSLKGYVFTDLLAVSKGELNLHFFSVVQTIREASKIPFETFANRISGHTIIFIVSFIGYAWLIIKHKIMLLTLPMLGLGFLAYFGGLRFTIYAVPVLALGMAFLIMQISDRLKNKYIKYSFISISTMLILMPNIKHIINYKVPTVFNNDEVVVLDKLKNIANRNDYVVGWWDYGYPIRYYADVKTLSDGGKHSGSVNFPTSYALTNTQETAAKILRLDVEYTENNYDLREKEQNLSSDEKTKLPSSTIAQMTLNYGYNDTNDFLTALSIDIKLPEKTRDIYLYLPNRMLNIYPTVTLFSNIDLMTGIKKQRPFFFKSNNFKESKDSINLGQGIVLSKSNGQLKIGNKTTTINKFLKTAYDNNGKLKVNIQNINPSSNLNVIFMQNYRQFLVVDNKTYNSLYFKLFVLEQYDKELFEATILTPLAKVYKLKI